MKRISHFTKREVSQLFKKARAAIRHPGLTILCAPTSPVNATNQRPPGRILVITPRKIGSAPERNRIRRRLKALFYEKKYFELGIDCIIIVKKPGIALSFAQLATLLEQALMPPA